MKRLALALVLAIVAVVLLIGPMKWLVQGLIGSPASHTGQVQLAKPALWLGKHAHNLSDRLASAAPTEVARELGGTATKLTDAAWRQALEGPGTTVRGAGAPMVLQVRDKQVWALVRLPSGVWRLGPLHRGKRDPRASLIGWLTLLLLAALVAGGLLVRPLRQLGRLSDATRALGRGDLGVRAPVERGALTEPVALALNHLADRVQRALALQQELLQAVAHELRTPLSRVRFLVEELDASAKGEGSQPSRPLEELEGELDAVDALLSEVLHLAEDAVALESAAEAVDLQALATALVARAQTAEGPRVELQTAGVVPPIAGRSGPVQRALRNLLANAVTHARSQVVVRLAHEPGSEAGSGSGSEGGTVVCTVDDDGPGIPEGDRAAVLRPFVRLSDATPGLGLGLAIARRAAASTGATLHITEAPIGGARVQICWPTHGA